MVFDDSSGQASRERLTNLTNEILRLVGKTELEDDVLPDFTLRGFPGDAEDFFAERTLGDVHDREVVVVGAA